MFTGELARGAEQMGVCLTQGQAEQFFLYHQMLLEAGRTMNLTRVAQEEKEAIDRNYLDSLAPLREKELFSGVSALIDVGTGAGLPGVALSIALPGVRVTLLDSLGKRVNFLRQVIARLDLNAVAIHARCEDAARLPELRDGFDLAVARAVADTALLAELALPFVRPGGRLLCYKGPAVEEELPRAGRALSELQGRFERIVALPIPGRDWDHRLLVVQKKAATPERYPRKAGVPERKPL